MILAVLAKYSTFAPELRAAIILSISRALLVSENLIPYYSFLVLEIRHKIVNDGQANCTVYRNDHKVRHILIRSRIFCKCPIALP